MLIGALLVVSQSSYSDVTMPFYQLYKQYRIWRVSVLALSDLGGKNVGEAFVYLAFRLGLGFWRVVKCRDAGASADGGAALVRKGGRDWCTQLREAIGPCAAAVGGYFLMNIMTVGYAAVWVNGSIFYTWCFTCGNLGADAFADAVFAKPEEEPALNKKYFLISIPCAVAGTMSIEQMSAVLLTFEVLAVVALFLRHKSASASSGSDTYDSGGVCDSVLGSRQ